MASLSEIKKPVLTEIALFDSHFRDAMKSRVALLDKITYYIVKTKGKQFRPLICILTAKMLGEVNDKTYAAATLVELLHTASLVHDDVVDNADQRRSFFSINALWKNKIAVLVGDYLLSRGLLTALSKKYFDLLEVLSVAVKEMSEGELLQLEKARRLDITEEIYYQIIRQKTASLIRVSCRCGAQSVTEDPAVIEHVSIFGEQLGLAFQIKDDLMDMSTKYGVVVFPGSNCDDDLIHVLGTVFGKQTEKIWHKESSLKGYNPGDVIFLPGGFSYGDYLRCGAIARFSPIMKAVKAFADNGGYVIGICNGFQILCEAGMLPGQLLLNKSENFVCKNVFLKPHSKFSPLTYDLDLHHAYSIPVAHADGRYFADESSIKRLFANHQVMFQYCDAEAEIRDGDNFNGSCSSIAGICNETGNVCGMMPHPERAAEAILGNTDGRALFESLFAYIKEHHLLIA